MAAPEILPSEPEATPPARERSLIEVPQFVEPRVDVLMLAYRRPSLPDAIAALVASTHSVDYRVSIMLNGTSDDVARAVREGISGIDLDESPVNLGFSAGMNRLAEKGQGEYIVFLNDDTEVADGWLDRLVATADELPDCGIVTSRLVFPDGRLQEAGARLSLSGVGVQVGWGQPDDDESRWHRREVDYGSAAALLIRRDAFEDVGGFDEAFFPAYFEDVDLALRVRAAGWKAIYEPQAIAIHHQWGSTSPGERTYSMTYNRRKFFDRWEHLFTDTLAPSNDGPDHPVEIPPGTEYFVQRGHRTTPWENYAQWLVEQLVESETHVEQAQAESRAAHEAAAAAGASAQAEMATLQTRAAAAENLARSEAARAQHHEDMRAEIEATRMWRSRRFAGKLARSTAAAIKAPLRRTNR